jgi:diacylglycerol kinase family enzyme
VNVWILCNEDAGRSLSADDLQKLVERAGHTVAGVSKRYDESSSLPRGNPDLLVAAGGDGTVATVAGIASKTSATMAILPLGTANNIAASLGLHAPVPELIAAWPTARPVPFDLGFARAGSNEWLVVEGVGGGLMPAGIARAQAENTHEDIPPAAEVAAAIRAFRDTLIDLEPHHWTLVLDGQEMSDAFLLVEVLNIRSIGPNLVFAPDASPSDGYFDVIMAQREHREALLAYLTHRAEGRDASLALPRRRSQDVVIEGCQALHIDDERIDTRGLGPISIRIEPAALHVLV